MTLHLLMHQDKMCVCMCVCARYCIDLDGERRCRWDAGAGEINISVVRWWRSPLFFLHVVNLTRKTEVTYHWQNHVTGCSVVGFIMSVKRTFFTQLWRRVWQETSNNEPTLNAHTHTHTVVKAHLSAHSLHQMHLVSFPHLLLGVVLGLNCTYLSLVI